MRYRSAMAVAVLGVALVVAPGAAASAQPGGSSWPAGTDGRAAGASALRPAWFYSVSCGAAGNCGAGGSFADSSGYPAAALVVSENKGVWAAPRVVARGKGPAGVAQATTYSVSCPSAGSCGAGGYYDVANGGGYAFVVSEKNNRWGRAEKVPGLARFNEIEAAATFSVSCASAGNCSASGWFADRHHSVDQGFVVGEADGRWGKAQRLPGVARLTPYGASISSLSCASPGNCSAGGSYETAGDHLQAFVMSEKNGVWGSVAKVRGLEALNTGKDAAVDSVSCASAGNCSAGGSYAAGKDQEGYAFVVDERNGVWGTIHQFPTLRRLGVNEEVASVSCATPGNCSAAGNYNGRGAGSFVVGEKNGIWGTARQIPGLARLGGAGDIVSVSCGSPGNCTGGGDYDTGGGATAAFYGFVVSERHGIWGSAEPAPGLAKLGAVVDGIDSVSCSSAGNCGAVGTYAVSGLPGSRGYPFAVNQHDGNWGTPQAFQPPGATSRDRQLNAAPAAYYPSIPSELGQRQRQGQGHHWWDR